MRPLFLASALLLAGCAQEDRAMVNRAGADVVPTGDSSPIEDPAAGGSPHGSEREAAPARPRPTPAEASAVATTTAFSLPLRMVGTEPFWGGTITEDAITLSGADRADMRFPAGERVVTGTGARWRTQSTGALPLELTLVRETCSDGMSDRVYPYAATAVLGRETLKGCAMTEAEFARQRP